MSRSEAQQYQLKSEVLFTATMLIGVLIFYKTDALSSVSAVVSGFTVTN